MKKTFTLAAIAMGFASPAMAANMENPLYLPTAGTVYSKTNVGLMYKKIDSTDAQVAKNHDGAEEFPIWRVEEYIGYGITDRLSIDGQFGYTYNDDTGRKGLHLGRVGMNYRVLADADEIVWDVYAAAHLGGVSKMTGTYNFSPAAFGPSTFDYDNYSTGQYGVWVGTKVGKTWDNLTGAIFAEAAYYFPGNNTEINIANGIPGPAAAYLSISDGTTATAKLKSFNDWNIGTKWSYEFDTKWTGGLGFAWKHHGAHEVESAKINGTIAGSGLLVAVTNSALEAGFKGYDFLDSFDEFPVSVSIANQISESIQVAVYGEYTFDRGDKGSQNSTDAKVEGGVRLNVQF
ncbi:MAG: hypothetical protein LBK26_02940 [Rickettsiales bacterium]|jgi:hypothetical protein|nr:hypothetical protein [Rickettsiales bacterium]